jgi:hypothetical protein
MDSRFTVLCVLKSGGKTYNPSHVLRLQGLCRQYIPQPFNFVCLTDLSIPQVTTVPLTKDWPGWWSKLELFLHDFGPSIYFDLDITIRKNLHWLPLLFKYDFTALQDFVCSDIINSSIMSWSGEKLEIPNGFSASLIPEWSHWPYKYSDQSWILNKVSHITRIQSLLPPKTIQSHKEKFSSPDVLVYHGKVKPWTPHILQPRGPHAP